jgi:hypothetical protein
MTSATTATNVPRDLRRDRGVEIVAVLLLGIATLGSAWCGYQASRWNGQEDRQTSQASNERVEGARLFGLAIQTASYDSSLIAQYAEAVASGNEALQEFYRTTLVRPAFLPTLDRWQAEFRAGRTPANLLEDEEYRNEQLAAYEAAGARAEASSAEARDAGANSDDFILITVLFASALFFAGVTTSFRQKFARLLLLLGAVLTIAYAAAQLSDLPVA